MMMMDEGRKRAAIACQLCRKRKRRCDGAKPKCSLCEDTGVECCYAEIDPPKPRASDEPSTSALLSRLGDIEVLLREHSRTLSTLSSQPHHQQVKSILSHSSHVSPQSIIEPPNTIFHDSPQSFAATRPQSANFSSPQYAAPSPSFIGEVTLPPMTIPPGHLTTTGSLLVSEKLKVLIGDFPVNFFLDTETRRPVPEAFLNTSKAGSDAPLPDVNGQPTKYLAEAFFNLVHSENPVLNEDWFWRIYRSTIDNGSRSDLESALFLVCLALGQVVQCMPTSTDLANAIWAPGAEFMTMALPTLIQEFIGSFGSSIVLPQALYLVARYFGFLGRPLQSWRFVHMASTCLQHFSPLLNSMTTSYERSRQAQAIIRTAWAIFGLECDLIAEHHLPRSGIEHLIDVLPLPQCGHPAPMEMLCWLAELSIRRLLNRVHHVVYMNDTDPGALTANRQPPDAHSPDPRMLPTLLNISAELDRQLETWYQLLPPAIKPDLANSSTWGLGQLNLLCRYFSAKDIIFRPFVMHVCNLPPGSELPSRIYENSQKCLDSCRSYLDVSERRLRRPCSSGEVIIHSIFAATVVLTVASLSPLLMDRVPDVEELQVSAIRTMERLAFEESCIQSMLWILSTVQVKAKMTKRVIKPYGLQQEDVSAQT